MAFERTKAAVGGTMAAGGAAAGWAGNRMGLGERPIMNKISVDSLRITWIADSAYRITVI